MLLFNYLNNLNLDMREFRFINSRKKLKGVRKGDVIYPKLFTNAMEDAYKLLEWKGSSSSIIININSEYITHNRFADDIVVMAESLDDLSKMLEDLNRVSQ